MKVISFSLWGDKPMYYIGALENIKLAREYYPEWKCRFYVAPSVPDFARDDISKQGGEVQIVETNLGNFWGMFWRFFAADDPTVDVMISRDCDSRLNIREKVAVDEWLKSDKCFHTMHDHYGHRSVPILGGMWGAKNGCVEGMSQKIMQWGNYANKGIDQHFLWQRVWPLVKDKTMKHGPKWGSRWGECLPFPDHPPLKFGGTYVGEIFDENNNPVKS